MQEFVFHQKYVQKEDRDRGDGRVLEDVFSVSFSLVFFSLPSNISVSEVGNKDKMKVKLTAAGQKLQQAQE